MWKHSEEAGDSSGEHDLIHSPPPRYMPFAARNMSRSYSSTPSLSSASDTDTESETPSVSSPCPSSPLDDEGLSHYFATRTMLPSHAEAFDAELFQRSIDVGNHNPYFPAVPYEPFSHSTLSSRMSSEIPTAVQTMKLRGLPSPALQPPSPFSLYAERETPAEIANALLDDASSISRVSTSSCASGVRPTKRSFVSRPSFLSEQALTPEITVESMRATTYGRDEVRKGEDVLTPSFSRRDS